MGLNKLITTTGTTEGNIILHHAVFTVNLNMLMP